MEKKFPLGMRFLNQFSNTINAFSLYCKFILLVGRLLDFINAELHFQRALDY